MASKFKVGDIVEFNRPFGPNWVGLVRKIVPHETSNYDDTAVVHIAVHMTVLLSNNSYGSQYPIGSEVVHYEWTIEALGAKVLDATDVVEIGPRSSDG